MHSGRDVDVRDMAIVHQFYRREFDLAPRIVRDLAVHEGDRRAGAEWWFGVTVIAMHHHHMAEDELMYPLMRGRVPDDLLDLMETQHEAVNAALVEVEVALASWRNDEPGSAQSLVHAFDKLLPVLVKHLDDEEDLIVPLIADCLSADEYGRMATSGNGVQEPRVLMMSFGAMIEQCSAEDAEFMLSHLDAEVRQSWYDTLAAEYEDLMSLLRKGLVPLTPVVREALSR